MQVEIFRGADLQVVEDEVNSYIRNKEVIDIKVSATYVGEEYDSTVVIVVMYNEKEDDPHE